MPLFPKGSYVKDKNSDFRFVLEELGELRFLSGCWKKEDANIKDSDGLTERQQTFSIFYTLPEMSAIFTPCTASEAGFPEEKWALRRGEAYYSADISGNIVLSIFSCHRTDLFRIKSNNCFRTAEECDAYIKEVNGREV